VSIALENKAFCPFGELAGIPSYEYVWTEEIIGHLAEHGVSPDEFESVVSNPKSRDISRATRRPCCFGEALDGRYLYCVYEMLDDATVIPVTAYEVPRLRQ
jgi:hypothetical protein